MIDVDKVPQVICTIGIKFQITCRKNDSMIFCSHITQIIPGTQHCYISELMDVLSQHGVRVTIGF